MRFAKINHFLSLVIEFVRYGVHCELADIFLVWDGLVFHVRKIFLILIPLLIKFIFVL